MDRQKNIQIRRYGSQKRSNSNQRLNVSSTHLSALDYTASDIQRSQRLIPKHMCRPQVSLLGLGMMLDPQTPTQLNAGKAIEMELVLMMTKEIPPYSLSPPRISNNQMHAVKKPFCDAPEILFINMLNLLNRFISGLFNLHF